MAKAVQTPGDAVKTQADSYNLSITQLAEGIKMSPSAARLLVNNKLRISVSIAQRLSKYFGKTTEYWINLQTAYDIAELSRDKKNTAVLKTISKAEKVPAAKKATAARASAKKAAGKKTPGRKPGVKKAAAKTAAPKAAKTPAKRGRKAAPKPETPAPIPETSSFPSWTPSSDNQ